MSHLDSEDLRKSINYDIEIWKKNKEIYLSELERQKNELKDLLIKETLAKLQESRASCNLELTDLELYQTAELHLLRGLIEKKQIKDTLPITLEHQDITACISHNSNSAYNVERLQPAGTEQNFENLNLQNPHVEDRETVQETNSKSLD